MGLNEDLVEAIALAHDLGHTPFGHAGQDVLNECMKEHSGFEHNLQSLRVVDELEERYLGFNGLNLTFEAREGCSNIVPSAMPKSWSNSNRKGGPPLLARTQLGLAKRGCAIWPTKLPTTRMT